MKIKYTGGFSKKIGILEEEINFEDKITLLELLNVLSKKHGVSLLKDRRRPLPDLNISLNGTIIRDAETILGNKDFVRIGFLLAGG